jgi:hypothetical protein
MRRWEIRLSHAATLAVAASGIAYFWMKHLIVNDDPFSVVNHPWQPLMLALHVVTAPVLVFVTGLVLRSHMLKKLAAGERPNRRSGLSSMVTLPVMIVSGYLLQVVTNPLASRIVLVAHLASSAIFVIAYAAHQWVSFRARRQTASRAVAPRQVA